MHMLKSKTSRDLARDLRPAPLAPVIRWAARTLAQGLEVVVRQKRPGAAVAALQIAKRACAMARIRSASLLTQRSEIAVTSAVSPTVRPFARSQIT